MTSGILSLSSTYLIGTFGRFGIGLINLRGMVASVRSGPSYMVCLIGITLSGFGKYPFCGIEGDEMDRVGANARNFC